MTVTLTIASGPGAGESIEVDREIAIGRDGCDLTIADPQLSRRHLVLRPSAIGIEVEDLDSMNGTFVDGERLRGARRLERSARLSLGDTELELEIELAGPAVTRVRERPAPVPAAEPAPPSEPAPPATRIARRPERGAAAPPADPSERQSARVALIMAVAAGLLGVIASVAHPQPDPDDTNVKAFLETIVPSSTWNVLHVLILFSVILGAAALVLLYRSLATGQGALPARIGVVVLLIATAVAVVWMLLDGIAMKAIASDWDASTGAAHLADERAAVAIEHFILALFSAWLVLWQGLAYVLFGLALQRDARFPSWAGALGMAIGSASFVLGLIQFGTERDALITHVLVPLVSVFGGIWIPLVAILWWRRARVAA